MNGVRSFGVPIASRYRRTAFWSLLACLLICSFVRIYRISEISMDPTLAPGDLVLVENFSAGIHVPSWFFYLDAHIRSRESGIERGDILAFRHPAEQRLYVKRCVAIPGDRIFERNKNFYLQIAASSERTLEWAGRWGLPVVKIDGQYWLENPYRTFYAVRHDPRVVGPRELIDYPVTTIPAHHYFMMGDFRDNSTDSRFFGPVSYDRIYYKVRFILHRSRTLVQSASLDRLSARGARNESQRER